MKKFCVLICCAFAGLVSAAQDNKVIKGKIVDSATGKPLEFVAVTLFIKGNAKPVTGTITDKEGAYTLTDLAEGTYSVTFESIGYVKAEMNNIIITKKNDVTELKTQRLRFQQNTMEAVTVTSTAKIIDNKIDRMVFNAEKDVSSQSGTAADVLNKVPQVSVDADGNVQLSGSSGIRFLINGKPSTAFGSSIADVLQTIPASQIKSIEVITNPGAKYDAQGLGGIINIILKTSKAKGYNGNISLTAGTRNENGSVNLNARNNNFGMNAFISGNKRLRGTVPYASERTTNNISGIDYLKQEGQSRFGRQGMQAGIGFDWTVKKLNSISGNISMNRFGNNGSGYTLQDLELSKGGVIPPVLSLINASSDVNFRNTDYGLNYKRTFAKEDRELEFGLTGSSGNNRTESFNEQISTYPVPFYYSTRNNNPGRTKETEITLDYTEPIAKDMKLGTGVKYSDYRISSNSQAFSYDQQFQNFIYDANLSNSLFYKQKVYAGYAELSFKIFNSVDVKAGGRYERTEIKDEFSNAQLQVQVPGYNTFVPSLFFSNKIGDAQTMKLSYSKRIERPDYNDLNPYVNVTDPKNLSTGNPALLPELGQRFEFSYNRDLGKKGSLMINLFYRLNQHDIQPYVVYYPFYAVGDSVFTNVAVSTRQNIGTEKNAGMNIFGDLHPTSKLGIRGNIFMFRRHTINAIDKGYDRTSFNYRFNLNMNYQFTKTLLAEFFGNFNSTRNEAQGRYPSFTTYSFAIRKQFWKSKGSIALTANNFLKKYVDQRTVLSSPAYSAIGFRQIPFRSVGINFAWKFGRLEFKKEKSADMNVPGGE